MKRPQSIGQILERIERPLYYCVLISYLGLTGIDEIAHPAWSWLEPVKATIFPAVLLVLFRYFDKMLRGPREVESYGDELGAAVSAAVAGSASRTHLDLLACTSVKYQVLLKDSAVVIGSLDLLIPSDQAILSAAFLRHDVREALVSEKARTLDAWFRMEREGRVKKIEIYELTFVPMFHVLLVERQRAVFGLFEPNAGGESLQTMGKFFATSGTGPGMALLHDFGKLVSNLKTASHQQEPSFVGAKRRIPLPHNGQTAHRTGGHYSPSGSARDQS